MPNDSLTLVPALPSHAPLLQTWRQQPEACRTNPFKQVTTEALAARLGRSSPDLRDRQAGAHRFMVQYANQLVGTVTAQAPVWMSGTVEIGYQLDDAWHGRGLGTRAVTLLVNRVFQEPELRRIWATVSVNNPASRRLLEKLDFRHEGVLRGHFVILGEPVDQCVYGLLRHEWRG